jgi:hypothetical protein
MFIEQVYREDSKNLLASGDFDDEADDGADKEREKEESSLSVSSHTLCEVGDLLFARERFEIATSLFEQVSLSLPFSLHPSLSLPPQFPFFPFFLFLLNSPSHV